MTNPPSPPPPLLSNANATIMFVLLVALSIVPDATEAFGVGVRSSSTTTTPHHHHVVSGLCSNNQRQRSCTAASRIRLINGSRNNVGSFTLQASIDGNTNDQDQEQQQRNLIQSWLTTHVPTLPPSDLQSYTNQLYNDNFRSLDDLNSINMPITNNVNTGSSSGSGRMEDLYFMKKGHRRVLMKKIGIMRAMKGVEGNRLGGSGSGTAASSSPPTPATTTTAVPGELDTSIEDWLAEQKLQADKELSARLAREKLLKPDAATDAARSNNEEKEGGGDGNANVNVNDPLDDVTSRYKSLDANPASSDDAQKEARRLEELKKVFRDKVRNNAITEDEEEQLLDDLAMRYQSLDVEDAGTKDKETRRLDELKRAFLQSAKNSNIEQEDSLDDFVSRYDSLDSSAMDGGSKDKESRRLDELKREFLQSAAKNSNIEEGDLDSSDDFVSRYRSLDTDAMDGGTKDKGARRLEETKRKFQNDRKRNKNYDEDEPLRLDLLAKPSEGEAAVDRKEQMRVEEFQRRARLSEEKKKSQKQQQLQDDDDDTASDDDGEEQDGGKAYYKTNEERRLEELERYFNKRRAARIAEEERLEQLLMDAKREAALMMNDINDEMEDLDGNKINVRRQSADDKALAREKMELDDFFDERLAKDGPSSLSTTMPPVGKGRGRDDPVASAPSGEADVYRDITKDNMQKRENLSLSTTMPPSARGANIVARPLASEVDKANDNEKGRETEAEDDDPEECVGDECWDITRSTFAERTSRSLATTLPPSNTKRDTLIAMEGDSEKSVIQNDDEPVFDITQNMFPESRGRMFRSLATPESARSPQSAFRDEDRSEMNDRSPEAALPEGAADVEEAYDDITHRSFPARRRSLATASSFEEGGTPKMNDGGNPNVNKSKTATSISEGAAAEEEEVYDITRSSFPDRGTAFNRGEKSEMNSRRPPDTRVNKVKTDATAKAKARASPAAPSPSKEEKKSELKSRASALYQRFQSERKSVFNKGERSEMNSRTRQPEYLNRGPAWSRKPTDRKKPDLDTVSHFPEERPSVSVNKKGDKAERQKNVKDPYLDITRNFSGDRPSMSVNTGTKKARTTSGSYQEGHRRVDQADRNQDASFVDITQKPFQGDRGSFILRVNSGTKKPLTTAGSYRESHGVGRNIAQNFSPDRASLLGHATRKDIDVLRRSNDSKSDSNDDYLDKNRFSADLAPHSPVTASATSAVWRESSTSEKKSDEKYLDTPRAFVKNLDMVPSTKAKGVTKNPFSRSEKIKGDNYLNKNPFSSNLGSSASSANKGTSAGTGQEYLDKPRVFQSRKGVDITSNTSGTRFKRSSDIPPELKHINNGDHYDVTTRAMSNVNEMARTKVSREIVVSTDELEEELYTDITRAPMSRLERTSSVVIDANKSSKVKQNKESRDDGDVGDDSAYEEVMYWLLTHLPQLREEDAIVYFKHLLEDGFDSIDMCGEILEEDLYFMEENDLRSLLRSLKDSDGGILSEKETLEDTADQDSLDDLTAEDGEDNIKLASETLEDTIDSARAELEKTQAWIAEQNQLVEKRLSARLADEKKARAVIQEKETGYTKQGSSSAQETSSVDKIDAQNGEPFADITRSRFVDRPSLSLAAPDSSFTRTDSSTASSRNKKQDPGDSFSDITRNIFKDRPSLSAVTPAQLSSPPPSLSKKSNDSKSRPPPSSDAPKDDTMSASSDSAPRAELYQLYLKRGYSSEHAQRLKDYFTTWTNNAKSHESKFTCIFTCPITLEHFTCGNRRDGGGEVEEKDGLFWYKNKKQAMNAAAAKALDCFSFRECYGSERKPRQLCEDEPYLSKGDAPSLPTLPAGISLPSDLIEP